MSLHPSILNVQSIKDNILSVLQNHALPASLRASLIGPQLAMVNEWSDQINLVLEHSEAPAPVNLVFAIRKDLFVAPQFVQCFLGVPAAELPPAFPAFLAMILKLISAQKTDKEKPPVKVFSLSISSYVLLMLLIIFFSLGALRASSLKRMSTLRTMSK
jgi:hypothetical protein